MLTFILPILSAIVCASIEYARIVSVKGQVDNVNKLWSVTIGVVFFVVSLALSVSYYDDIMPDDVLFYAIYYSGCRGLFYSPTLNALRGLRFDYFSDSTNSIIDSFFSKIGGFWASMVAYLIITIISGFIWLLR